MSFAKIAENTFSWLRTLDAVRIEIEIEEDEERRQREKPQWNHLKELDHCYSVRIIVGARMKRFDMTAQAEDFYPCHMQSREKEKKYDKWVDTLVELERYFLDAIFALAEAKP